MPTCILSLSSVGGEAKCQRENESSAVRREEVDFQHRAETRTKKMCQNQKKKKTGEKTGGRGLNAPRRDSIMEL